MVAYKAKDSTMAAIAAKVRSSLKDVFNMNLIIDDSKFVVDSTVIIEIYFKSDPTRFAMVSTIELDLLNDFPTQVANWINMREMQLLAMNTRRNALNQIATKSE